MKDKCAAGIILYNPNISRLEANITSVISQVDVVILFDNGSNNISDIENFINKYKKIKLIKSEENKGIAHALNVLVNEAEFHGYEWILTLDQDSILQDEAINVFSKFFENDSVAIICPTIIDIRRKNIKYIDQEEEEYTNVNFCITSGSLVNVGICKEIGMFDDWLFIDFVDNEYCKRIELAGYKILRVNTVKLDHELGNLLPSKYEKYFLYLGNLFGSETVGKLSYKRIVNPIRLYYTTRNMIYLTKKYKLYTNRKKDIGYIAKNSISSLLRGSNKMKLIKAIYKGMVDGSKSKIKNNILKTDSNVKNSSILTFK